MEPQEPPPGQRPNATQRFFMAVAEIIDNDDIMPGAEQFQRGMAADITGAAGNQNFHE